MEAVEVLVSRLEAADPGARREVALLPSGHRLLDHDVLEVPVLRDLELQAEAVLGVAELGPEDRPLRVGEPGGDPERESAGLRHRYAPLASDRRVVGQGGRRCAGRQTGDQELAATETWLRIERLQVEARILEFLQVHRVPLLSSRFHVSGTKSSPASPD